MKKSLKFIHNSRFREELTKYKQTTVPKKVRSNSQASRSPREWAGQAQSPLLSTSSTPRTQTQTQFTHRSQVSPVSQVTQSRSLSPRVAPSLTRSTDWTQLVKDVEKWKEFGTLMADSYEDVKRKYNLSLKAIEENNKTLRNLTDQIEQLKHSIIQETNDKDQQEYKLRHQIESMKTVIQKSIQNKRNSEFTLMAHEIARLRSEIDQTNAYAARLSRDERANVVTSSMHMTVASPMNHSPRSMKDASNCMARTV